MQVSQGRAGSFLGKGWGARFRFEILSSENFPMDIGMRFIKEGKAAFSPSRMYCVQVHCWTMDWITECQIKFCCFNNQTNWPVKGRSWSVIQSVVQSMTVLNVSKTNSIRRRLNWCHQALQCCERTFWDLWFPSWVCNDTNAKQLCICLQLWHLAFGGHFESRMNTFGWI